MARSDYQYRDGDEDYVPVKARAEKAFDMAVDDIASAIPDRDAGEYTSANWAAFITQCIRDATYVHDLDVDDLDRCDVLVAAEQTNPAEACQRLAGQRAERHASKVRDMEWHKGRAPPVAVSAERVTLKVALARYRLAAAAMERASAPAGSTNMREYEEDFHAAECSLDDAEDAVARCFAGMTEREVDDLADVLSKPSLRRRVLGTEMARAA